MGNYCRRFSSSVNVVAKRNHQPLTASISDIVNDLFFPCLKQVHAAMDITYGIDGVIRITISEIEAPTRGYDKRMRIRSSEKTPELLNHG